MALWCVFLLLCESACGPVYALVYPIVMGRSSGCVVYPVTFTNKWCTTRYYIGSLLVSLSIACTVLYTQWQQTDDWCQAEVEVTLRLTVSQSVSQSVCLGIEYPCKTYDQILFPVGMLLSEICGLVSAGRPLWQEDGSAICIVITQ
jgi:hypothetical protein